MFSWENPEDRVAIVQMNADLRHAQLELLSAQCATHRLRLRFSSQNIARYAQRETLRKAIEAANGLQEYFSSIDEIISLEPSNLAVPEISREKVAEAINLVSRYLQKQRDHYYALGKPLDARHRAVLQPFFSEGLLDQVRVVESFGNRVPNPSFFTEAKALGFTNLPELTHMPSITFIDVIVFNEHITSQALFHALVHMVQFQALGLQRYTEAFVRGFLRTHSHVTVPLEAHTFALDSRFATNPAEGFSVEENVRMWIREGRY